MEEDGGWRRMAGKETDPYTIRSPEGPAELHNILNGPNERRMPSSNFRAARLAQQDRSRLQSGRPECVARDRQPHRRKHSLCPSLKSSGSLESRVAPQPATKGPAWDAPTFTRDA